MVLSYTEIFKYSDVFNPISSTTLFLAGKLAELAPRQVVLDLGSGKGTPSLLWASVFGVHVEGYDQESEYVEYANSRAAMLNLSHRVKYYCQDVKQIKTNQKYDVVASLGLGVTSVYGNTQSALNLYRMLLRPGGFVIFAEPIWLEDTVSPETLKALGADETDFLTKQDLNRLVEKLGYHVTGCFVSTREDWEYYIHPVIVAMRELVTEQRSLAEAAQTVINGFNAECDAVGQYWDMVLWVLKASMRN